MFVLGKNWTIFDLPFCKDKYLTATDHSVYMFQFMQVGISRVLSLKFQHEDYFYFYFYFFKLS